MLAALNIINIVSTLQPTIMTRNNFYNLIDEIIEADPGTIKGGEQLSDLPAWDSLAVIGFIAEMAKHLGLILPVKPQTEA